jgi:hypothetical protein
MSLSRRRFLQIVGGGVAAASTPVFLRREPVALAADAGLCSHANPIVRENNCLPGSFTENFRITPGMGSSALGGFTTKSSYNLGEDVPVKLVSYMGGTTEATLDIYRLGYYDGQGGRLVKTITNVPVLPGWGPTDADKFGFRTAKDWPAATTISHNDLPVSGIYLIKMTTSPTAKQWHIPLIVRDDARPRKLLVAMPTNTWQAYNNMFGWSLYASSSYGGPTAANGTPIVSGVNPAYNQARGVKVSFDRPFTTALSDYNWVLHTEFALVYWLERMGYDTSYTDDAAMTFQAAQLRSPNTKTLVIAGHSEYWTKGMRDNVEAARDAGTNIVSMSANTGYWQVRYENADASGPATGIDDARTLVCFKSVEATGADGTKGVNDYGPGNADQGQATSALGSDRTRGGGDDHPEYATTTFRDPGVNAGDASAPNDDSRGHGRVGPGRPENALFGVMFLGDADIDQLGLKVPAGSGNGGEFGAHTAWRHTSVSTSAGTIIGSNIVGWEWDGIPGGAFPYAGAAAVAPAGVKRLSATSALGTASTEYLQDYGRVYGGNPPAGQSPDANAVTYRASSGAYVFASGTMQWSWGLGPHYHDGVGGGTTYEQPRADSSDPRIQQATYNILVDGGVLPDTPTPNIVPDGAPPPPPPPPPPPGPTAPAATTSSASSVRRNTAVLNGRVNPNGQPTSWYFEYGRTTSYGNTTTQKSLAAGTSLQSVSAAISGLSRYTVYHFRVVATWSSGAVTRGADASFRTLRN